VFPELLASPELRHLMSSGFLEANNAQLVYKRVLPRGVLCPSG